MAIHPPATAADRPPVPQQRAVPRLLRTAALLAVRSAWDIVLFLLGLCFSILFTFAVPGASDRHGNPTDTGIVMTLLVIVLWTAVLLRRRLPVVALSAGAVITLLGMDSWLLLIGIHHTLIRLPRRPALIIAGIGAALALAAAVRDIARGDSSAPAELFGITGSAMLPGSHILASSLLIIITLLSLGTAVGLAALVRSRAETSRAQHVLAAEHLRNEHLSLELTRQTERDRLARDIHDALAHRLSVISLQSGALELAAGSTDPDVARAAQVLRGQAHASLQDLRGLLGDLRAEVKQAGPADQAPPSQASLSALPQLIRSVRDTGAAVDAVVLIDGSQSAGTAFGHSVYRIVQEALTNCLKHAPGAPIGVYVTSDPERGARIRITNPVNHSQAVAGAPGAGLSSAGAGAGIEGMRERCRLVGGHEWIGVHENEFIVDISLPWTPAA